MYYQRNICRISKLIFLRVTLCFSVLLCVSSYFFVTQRATEDFTESHRENKKIRIFCKLCHQEDLIQFDFTKLDMTVNRCSRLIGFMRQASQPASRIISLSSSKIKAV